QPPRSCSISEIAHFPYSQSKILAESAIKVSAIRLSQARASGRGAIQFPRTNWITPYKSAYEK
ncbi:MAG TPA: hypothetical protein VGG95_11380, partial [Edaphobacter sp.]